MNAHLKMNARSVEIGIRTSLALSSLMLLFSCGSSVKNLPSVATISPGTSACPPGVGGMPSNCCDPTTGDVITPPTSNSCTVAVPGAPGVNNPLGGGAASAGNSTGESGTAASLTGGQKAMGTYGQSSAATAGAVPSSVGASQSGLGIPGTPLGGAAGNNTAGGGGQSGGSGASLGSVATAPDALGSPDPSASTGLTTDGQVAAYSAGGAGAGGLLPNGSHETGFHFGNGLSGEGGAGGAATDVAFGGQRDPASAMASGDPDDYFTRIGLQDSLFKKVEKRYRTQSAEWATAELSTPTALVKARK